MVVKSAMNADMSIVCQNSLLNIPISRRDDKYKRSDDKKSRSMYLNLRTIYYCAM